MNSNDSIISKSLKEELMQKIKTRSNILKVISAFFIFGSMVSIYDLGKGDGLKDLLNDL